MGLDIVELVYEVEEHFGVKMANEDAEQIRTVDDMYRWLCQVIPLESSPNPCASSRAFWCVHGALQQSLRLPRHQLRPNTLLDPLLPEEPKRAIWWKRLAVAGDIKLPKLRPPAWTRKPMWSTWLPCSMAAIASLLMVFAFDDPNALMAMLVLAPILMSIWWVLTFSLERRLPPRCETIGGLTRAVLALNHRRFVAVSAWTRATAWWDLQRIISEQLSIPLEEVTPEKDFVRDFRVD